MQKTSNSDQIELLILCKYPDAYSVDSVGSEYNALSALFNGEERVREQSEESKVYREHLLALPSEEINKLYDAELYRIACERLEEEQRAKKIQESRYFYNQPNADADFNYWSKMSFWSFSEAVALSFGKDPQIVTWDRLESSNLPLKAKYAQVRELVLRAVRSDELDREIAPQAFLAWVKHYRIDFPEELEKLIIQRDNLQDWKTLHDLKAKEYGLLSDKYKKVMKENEALQGQLLIFEQSKTEFYEKPLSTKERETALKIIIGIAIDAYGYDPKALRSPTPKEISSVLYLLGIPRDEDTVRKWLREAAEHLPPSTD